jgi:hypothetical protein
MWLEYVETVHLIRSMLMDTWRIEEKNRVLKRSIKKGDAFDDRK